MLKEYKEMLEELQAEIMTDAHAHSHDTAVVQNYIENAVRATDLLIDYIDAMNHDYN